MNDRPAIEKLKVYGERNTGTRFLKHLMKKNFGVKMMRSSNENYHFREQILEQLSDHEWLIRRIAIERYNGIVNRRLELDSFGWKHTSPPIEAIKAAPEMAASTLFVVLVKHPVYWALSFKERPYDSYFRYDDMTVSQFLRHVFVPTERDNVPDVTYDSAVGLYAAKVDGYRALADLAVPFQLVRYEDLITDVAGFMKRLEDLHGLPRRQDSDVIREDSTKGDEHTLDDYKSKYRLDKVRDGVSAEDYDFIIEKFGKDRLAWLGYDAS